MTSQDAPHGPVYILGDKAPSTSPLDPALAESVTPAVASVVRTPQLLDRGVVVSTVALSNIEHCRQVVNTIATAGDRGTSTAGNPLEDAIGIARCAQTTRADVLATALALAYTTITDAEVRDPRAKAIVLEHIGNTLQGVLRPAPARNNKYVRPAAQPAFDRIETDLDRFVHGERLCAYTANAASHKITAAGKLLTGSRVTVRKLVNAAAILDGAADDVEARTAAVLYGADITRAERDEVFAAMPEQLRDDLTRTQLANTHVRDLFNDLVGLLPQSSAELRRINPSLAHAVERLLAADLDNLTTQRRVMKRATTGSAGAGVAYLDRLIAHAHVTYAPLRTTVFDDTRAGHAHLQIVSEA